MNIYPVLHGAAGRHTLPPVNRNGCAARWDSSSVHQNPFGFLGTQDQTGILVELLPPVYSPLSAENRMTTQTSQTQDWQIRLCRFTHNLHMFASGWGPFQRSKRAHRPFFLPQRHLALSQGVNRCTRQA